MKKLYEEENIRAIAESIRGKTGAETTYTTATMPSGVEEVYEAGKAAGGGGGSDYSEVTEMLTTLPWLTRAYVKRNKSGDSIESYGGSIISFGNHYDQCVIFPPWITEVDECYTDNFTPDGDTCTAIFFPKTPPTVGWQGAWSGDGGGWTPKVIFVPDESLEAYKTTTNLAAFASRMKPLSEYNGEGYYGDMISFRVVEFDYPVDRDEDGTPIYYASTYTTYPGVTWEHFCVNAEEFESDGYKTVLYNTSALFNASPDDRIVDGKLYYTGTYRSEAIIN